VPIHAAGIYEGYEQECCSDYVVSSYTPTLETLLRAQRGAQSINKKQSQLTVITDAASSEVLHVEKERITEIAKLANLSVNTDQPATKSQVLASLKLAHIAHIACRASRNEFQFTDYILTVSDLMELDMENAFLAFLSYGNSLRVDEQKLDDGNTAVAMLYAGFRSVVGTMG
jgi:Asp-tRNA(Asn)/Glu-tRNA(Gln) amidotransferase C subunit